MELNRYLVSHVFCFAVLLHLALGDCSKLDLGMESGSILDNWINASSELHAGTAANNGRLNYTAGSSWCASTNDSNPYLQIDLQTPYIICAVSIQGNSQGDQWVKTYTLQSSSDGTAWTDYKEDGQVKIFEGNRDRNTENKKILYEGLLTRWLRFVGKTGHNGFCMRTEVFGVKQKPANIASGRPTAQSSIHPCGESWKAVDGNLNVRHDNRGYCAHTTEDNPSWWRLDLGFNQVPVLEVRIVNRFSTSHRIAVRSQDYKITIGDNQNVRVNSKCIGRYSFINFVASAVCYRENTLLRPGISRYLGIMTTKAQILQLCEVEVYARENLALRKSTAQISTYNFGASAKAVDGKTLTSYVDGHCTHTNPGESNPWWRVDFGRVEPVAEVYIVNRGDCCGYRLNPFEILVGTVSSNGSIINAKCGVGDYSVPQDRGASFFCHPVLFGISVTVRRTSSVTEEPFSLCEVEVYSARRACQIQSLGLESSYAFTGSIFSASSSSVRNKPFKARLNGNGHWSPSTDSNSSDYLQINLPYEVFICAVATQGSPNTDHWTKKYKMHVSLSNKHWITYQEKGADKIFHGNGGRNDIVKHNLAGIVRARFIRFQPTAFSTRKALRVAVYGSPLPSVPTRSPTNLTLRAVSSTSIVASWEPPPEYSVNGVIKGFKLFYKRRHPAGSPATMVYINNATVRVKNVTGLDKFTHYEFQMVAFTSAGDGPKGSVVVARTKEDVPVRSPINFRVIATSSTSITANWQLPPAESRNGIIRGFKVFCKMKGFTVSPIILTVHNGSALTETVYGLQKNAEYELQVLAFTSVGVGPRSYVKSERTKVEPPTIIEEASPSSVMCGKETLCLLNCRAASNYPVIYSWTKNGKMVSDCDKIKVMNSTLAITPHHARDYGEYVCNVTSRFGSTSYPITISEALQSSIAAERMKAAQIMSTIFRCVMMGLSGAVVLLIIVVAMLVMRKRRKSRKKKAKTQMMYKAEERKRPGIPRDRFVSQLAPSIGLHPSPSEEQLGTSLEDGKSQNLKGGNTSDESETMSLDGEKQRKKGGKREGKLENPYEVPIDVNQSEPGNYMALKKNASVEQTYQSRKKENQDCVYYNRGFNREKLEKPGHDFTQNEYQSSPGYYNRSRNRENLELSAPGYYNRSSNRKRLEKPGEDVYEEADAQA